MRFSIRPRYRVSELRRRVEIYFTVDRSDPTKVRLVVPDIHRRGDHEIGHDQRGAEEQDKQDDHPDERRRRCAKPLALTQLTLVSSMLPFPVRA
jgi:hypothetical protein